MYVRRNGYFIEAWPNSMSWPSSSVSFMSCCSSLNNGMAGDCGLTSAEIAKGIALSKRAHGPTVWYSFGTLEPKGCIITTTTIPTLHARRQCPTSVSHTYDTHTTLHEPTSNSIPNGRLVETPIKLGQHQLCPGWQQVQQGLQLERPGHPRAPWTNCP